MAWTTTNLKPSAAGAWTYTKNGNSAKTWNHFRLYYECRSARLGATYYLAMRCKFTKEGQNGDYYPPTAVYFRPDGTKITKGSQGSWSSWYYRALGSNATTVTCSVGAYSSYAGTGYPSWVQRIPAVTTYTLSYNKRTDIYNSSTGAGDQTKYKNVDIDLRGRLTGGGSATQTVTITGNANGGSWSGSNGNATYTTTAYYHSKWLGGSTQYDPGASFSGNANTTFTAIWTISAAVGQSYTLPTGTPTKASTTTSIFYVGYNANGGSSTPATATSSKTVTYTFAGWFTAASGGTQATTSRRVLTAETLYAHYTGTAGNQSAVTLASAITHNTTTANGYVVTFNPNGGATTKANQTAIRTFSWSFEKWHMGSVASSTAYSAGASFTPSENTTMCANWTTAIYSQGQVLLPSATECTRTDYILLGWATANNATTANYPPSNYYSPTANITLYAVWGQLDKAYVNGDDVAICIYNGSTWDRYSAWIYDTTGWVKYS